MKQLLSIVLFSLLAASCAKATPTPTLEAYAPAVESRAMEQQVVVVKPGEALEIITPTPKAVASKEPYYSDIYLTKAEILKSGNNTQPQVRLVGALPSPCHKLFVKLDKIDTDNKILIKVFSTISLPNNCASAKLMFDDTIVIDGLSSGKYAVWVSQGKIGDVIVP